MTTHEEIVFQVFGEGGGITICREKNELGIKYIYHHKESDPTDEGLDVSVNDEYTNFEQPFQLVNNKYPWYMLYIDTVHDDFKNYIIEKLVEKINEESVTADDLEHSKDQLEEVFKMKLNHKVSSQTNNLIWSCEKMK